MIIWYSFGVPQGSHLGPLLCILFINDLPYIFDSLVEILLFADDAKLFSVIKSPNDVFKLQSNLDNFVDWSRVNHLLLNINKCSVITFSRINNVITYNYMIDNHTVTRVSFIKDLDIIFNFNMDFSIHIITFIKKAFKML